MVTMQANSLCTTWLHCAYAALVSGDTGQQTLGVGGATERRPSSASEEKSKMAIFRKKPKSAGQQAAEGIFFFVNTHCQHGSNSMSLFTRFGNCHLILQCVPKFL